jgi:hypothetical protein
MDVVNQDFRPAFTPWGQAKFDAARPIVGPRAVAGEENDPVLRCVPDGPPMPLAIREANRCTLRSVTGD